MWLKYAINDSGALIYIEQVPRGQTHLHCPYCTGLLTAKKGQIKQPHFAHTAETCRQVERSQDLDLPAYDNFNLHLPGRVLKALRDFDERDDHAGRDLLERHKLIEYNEFARVDRWQLTKRGKLPLGKLSLMLFCEFQEPLILNRYHELETLARDVYDRPDLEALMQVERQPGMLSDVPYATWLEERNNAQKRLTNAAGMDIDTALADLRIYRAQWQRILGLTLYFLEINDGQYHKIGVTARPIEQRLDEIQGDLRPLLGTVTIRVVDTFPHRGNVELYFKYRYASQRAALGDLTEYYQFADPKTVIRDLRRMKSKTLTDLERAILTGERLGIEERLRLDAIEVKRRAAIRRGMAKAKMRGQPLGRPEKPDQIFLAQYAAVQAALENGLSLRKVAAVTGVAVNTIRKVQRLMENTR